MDKKRIMRNDRVGPFNSALETGVRTVAVLVESYPRGHDLARLVQYDYLTVHSADAKGPPSLHPALPFRSGELLVRRGLVEAGLRLMMSRSLVRRELQAEGILYVADDEAGAFLDCLQSVYILKLRRRAGWVATTFDDLNGNELTVIIKRLFETWRVEFQPFECGSEAELL